MPATCCANWSSKEAWGLPMNKIHVSVADWHKDIAEIRRIREAVFIAEQSVPPELEWDADDADAVHFLAFEGDFPIGTARLLPSGEIGRVSVLKDWRGLKVGDKLMEAVIGEAENAASANSSSARRCMPRRSMSDWASRLSVMNSSKSGFRMSIWCAKADPGPRRCYLGHHKTPCHFPMPGCFAVYDSTCDPPGRQTGTIKPYDSQR